MANASISEQVEEVAREVRTRERLYPSWIESGRYRKETAERKLATLRAALRSLMFLQENAEWIRAEHRVRHQRIEAGIMEEAERAALEDLEEVQAVRKVFPDAELRVIDEKSKENVA